MSKKAFDDVVAESQKVLSLAEAEIEAFLQGKKTGSYGTTQLAKDVAKTLGCSFSFAFPLISSYVSKREDIVSKRGPNGGFQRVKANGSESPKDA